MEPSTDDVNWGSDFNDPTSVGTQTAHMNFDFWDPMLFAEDATLTPDSQTFPNASIDSMIMTPQSVQDITSSTYNAENQATFQDHLVHQNYSLPLEHSNANLKTEAEELRHMFQEMKRELVIVKSELCTIKSNHEKLLRWTLDMGETMKRLLKWLAEHIRANVVGQDESHLEELVSWLNPGTEG